MHISTLKKVLHEPAVNHSISLVLFFCSPLHNFTEYCKQIQIKQYLCTDFLSNLLLRSVFTCLNTHEVSKIH